MEQIRSEGFVSMPNTDLRFDKTNATSFLVQLQTDVCVCVCARVCARVCVCGILEGNRSVARFTLTIYAKLQLRCLQKTKRNDTLKLIVLL